MHQRPLFPHAAPAPGSADHQRSADTRLEDDPHLHRQLEGLHLTFGEARVYRAGSGLIGAARTDTPQAAERAARNLLGLTRLLTARGLRGLRKTHGAHLTPLQVITWQRELRDLPGPLTRLDGGHILGAIQPDIHTLGHCPHCAAAPLHVAAGTVHGGTWHPDGPVGAPVIHVQTLRCPACARQFPPITVLDGDDGGLSAALRAAPNHPSPLEIP